MENLTLDKINAELSALVDRAYRHGYETGAKETASRIMAAAGIAEISFPEQDAVRSGAKAPRGSVQQVVAFGFQIGDGFTVEQLMQQAAQSGLPLVSEGSIRNFLRDMEKAETAYRQGDRWYAKDATKPPPPNVAYPAFSGTGVDARAPHYNSEG